MEHCSSPVSERTFITSNYGAATTPRFEWELVMDAETAQSKLTKSKGRRIPNWKNLVELELSKKAGLISEEVIAVVLYTGPMVSKSSVIEMPINL